MKTYIIGKKSNPKKKRKITIYLNKIKSVTITKDYVSIDIGKEKTRFLKHCMTKVILK